MWGAPLRLLVGVLGLVLGASVALAHPEDEPASEVPASEATPDSYEGPLGDLGWSPPPPSPTGFDWIKLDTGEWLKGEIRRMRDEELDFESDNLGDLTIDWDEVYELRSPKVHTYRFEGRIVLQGTALMREGVIAIDEGGVVTRFDREALVATVRGTGRELDLWFARVSLGIAARGGNTNQTDLTATANLRRETALQRFTFDYNGAVGETNDTQNVNTSRIGVALDHFMTRRLYLTVPAIEAFQDRFQNIQLRFTPTVGLGYQIVNRKGAEWDATLGVGYQLTRYESTFAGLDSEIQTGVVTAGTSFDVDITKRLELEGSYDLQLGVQDSRQTNHHATALLSLEITKYFDLDVSFNFDRVEQPVPDADGDLPKQNDYRLSVGLAIDYP